MKWKVSQEVYMLWSFGETKVRVVEIMTPTKCTCTCKACEEGDHASGVIVEELPREVYAGRRYRFDNNGEWNDGQNDVPVCLSLRSFEEQKAWLENKRAT